MFNGGVNFKHILPLVIFYSMKVNLVNVLLKLAKKKEANISTHFTGKKGRLFHIYGKSPKHNLSICHVFHVFPSAPHFRPQNNFDQNEWIK